MDLTLSNLTRTLRSYFLIGTVRLKDSGGILNIRSADDSADANLVAGAIQLTTSPGIGQVLTSDASGNGTWQSPSTTAASIIPIQRSWMGL